VCWWQSHFLVALSLASHFAKKRGLSHEKIVNLGVYCALAGMVGAKLLMIALDPEYREHPGEIFTLATLQSAGIFFRRLHRGFDFRVAVYAKTGPSRARDLRSFRPGLALGHGIGRLGCFAAGCCWGKTDSSAVGRHLTNTSATTGVPLNIALHPTQLYEAFAEGIICLILLRQYSRPHRDGQVIGLYLLLYGLVRFAVEFLREHDSLNPFGGPFTLEQWLALALAAAGTWLVFRAAAGHTAQAAPVRA